MKVEFTLTKEDVWAFDRYMAHPRNIGKWTYLAIALLFIVALTLVVSSLTDARYTKTLAGIVFNVFFTLLLPLLMLVVFWALFYRYHLRKMAQRNPGLYHPQVMEFNPEGFRLSMISTEVIVKWAAVTEIAETDRHFFVMIDKERGYIVPKRALGTDQDAFHFTQQVRGCWKAS